MSPTRLQGSCTAAQAQRRIKEHLGRETVSRAARRVLRCFVDWGVLEDTGEKGVYQAAPVQLVEDKQLAAWLIEAAMVASGNDKLELFRQGLEQDMIVLQWNCQLDLLLGATA